MAETFKKKEEEWALKRWATARPEEKGKGTRWFGEWLPGVGTYIVGKDAYWYYKDKKWLAANIMAAATLVSAAGDVFLLFGAAPAKGAAAAAEKGLARIAAKEVGKVVETTVEKTATVAGRRADSNIVGLLIKKGGAATDEEIRAVAKKAAEKVWRTAEKRVGKKLEEEVGDKAAGETSEKLLDKVGRKAVVGKVKEMKIDEVVDKAVKEGILTRDMLKGEGIKKAIRSAVGNEEKITREIIHAYKGAVSETGAEAGVKGTARLMKAVEAIKKKFPKAAKGLEAAAKELDTSIQKFRQRSLMAKLTKTTIATARAQEGKIMKGAVYTYSGLMYVPAAVGDAAQVVTGIGFKGAKFLGKKVIERPIAAVSAEAARIGLGKWIAAPIARKTKVKKEEAKKEVKGVKVSEVGLLAYVKATKYIKESVPLEYQQLAKSEALLKKIAPGKEWKEIKSFIDKVVLDKYAEDNVIPNITVREEGGETHESREWAKKCVKADRPLDKYTLKDQIAYFDSVFAARPDIRKKMK